jgi:heterodisulfide reductase subunit B
MEKAEYMFFLGCLIPYRVLSYEISARKVLRKLGVKLVEMPNANCCGYPVAPLNYDLSLTLAARNLCIAEEQKMNIITLCNGCFSNLNETKIALNNNEILKTKINNYLKEINLSFKGNIEVKHLVHLLIEDIGVKKLKESIKKPLSNLQVVQHTGCHLLRPKKHVEHGDNSYDPKTLKVLIGLTGAECVNYLDEMACCGNTIIGINEDIPFLMAKEKLDNIQSTKAQVLITVCPSCHMMYDFNQPRIEKTFDVKYRIPVLHYTQLLGLAMGFKQEELGLNLLRIKPNKLLEMI